MTAAERRPQVMVVMSRGARDTLFDETLWARLNDVADLGQPAHTDQLSSPDVLRRLADVEVLITGWGCPKLDAGVLHAAPRLRAALHAAGSVKGHLTEACWERDLLVTTAADANAVPVAEYTLAAILFAGKRIPTLAVLAQRHPGEWAFRDSVPERSNFRRTVGLIGFSRIGRRVAELLRPFDLDVLVADPYADPAAVAAAGAELVDLDAMLPRAQVLSVHAPSLRETRHLLDARRLALLPDYATIVNTARGALVDTAALTAECVTGRLYAVLDVVDPEPLPADSALFGLPNVMITPHVAGSLDTETRRMTELAIEELARYARGAPPIHPVRRTDLDRMA